MARGEIKSTWSLDTAQYYKSLEEGLKRTKVTADAINQSLASSAPMPSFGGRLASRGFMACRVQVRPHYCARRTRVRL